MDWLGSLEVIIQVYSPTGMEQRVKLLKLIIFSLLPQLKYSLVPFFQLCWYIEKHYYCYPQLVKVVDIYLAASRLSKYSPLFTPTSVNIITLNIIQWMTQCYGFFSCLEIILSSLCNRANSFPTTTPNPSRNKQKTILWIRHWAV